MKLTSKEARNILEQERENAKEDFDNLLGYNLYDLFPKIKNNL